MIASSRKAFEFARTAHLGQVRKLSAAPYIVHPVRVAATLAKYGEPLPVVDAGMLHDVVEDTPFTLQDITAEFGQYISQLVYWVTNPKPTGVKRDLRKRIERQKINQAPPEAKSIRLADLYDNLFDFKALLLDDPEFATLYINEKVELIPYLRTGNSRLFDLVHARVYDCLVLTK